MDRSTKTDGLTPTLTDTQQQNDNNQQIDQSLIEKKTITTTSSTFVADTDKARKISTTNFKSIFKKLANAKNKTTNKFFDYITQFKNSTPKNVKIFLASALILLAPVVGCAIVAIYLFASSKADKREATTVTYTNPLYEDDDNSTEEFHNLFETQPLNSIFDEKTNQQVSEIKVINYLFAIYQQRTDESDKEKARTPEINKLFFKLAPVLTDFLNSKSNNQNAINKAIKTVLVSIKDLELHKLNNFFEALKNDKQIMASLVDDPIAMATINLTQDMLADK